MGCKPRLLRRYIRRDARRRPVGVCDYHIIIAVVGGLEIGGGKICRESPAESPTVAQASRRAIPLVIQRRRSVGSNLQVQGLSGGDQLR